MAQSSTSDPTLTSPGSTRSKSKKAGGPPGLIPVADSVTAWQRVSGPAMAANWARSTPPPLEPDKAGFYAAALAVAGGDNRARIALCLLWCDMEAGRYCLAYLEHYRLAFTTYPDDERAAFFIAALCHSNVIDDDRLKRDAYARMLAPGRAGLPYWKKFLFNADRVRHELAGLFIAESDVMTPDRVVIVEQALDSCPEHSPDRVRFAAYLAAAFRSTGRQDTTAETVYRYVFANAPEDRENNAYLARIYHEHKRRDANACAVYARMIPQCEAQGSAEEANRWTQRLAHAYLALNRADEVTLSAYQKAVAMEPENLSLEAAYAASFARRRVTDNLSLTVEVLERTVAREKELRPLFEFHGWNWLLVIRSLAFAYGHLMRSDEEAAALFARATELCPEDRELWSWYARVLVLRGDYSEKAIIAYERAIEGKQPEESLQKVLATAYIINNAHEGPRRVAALRLWEELFRQNQASPEMIEALAKAYTGEDRVNDIALMLWERTLETDPKNGIIALRLAQEWRARNDFDRALGYYQVAAKYLPKNFVAQYEYATLLVQQTADYVTAVKLLQKAVKMAEGGRHLGANFALGEALMAREDREAAKEIFQKILDTIDPNHTPTLLHLAQLNLKYDEEGLKLAEALYEKARYTSPDHPETYRRLADLYREKGQSDEEEAALERYLQLSEPDAEKYRQLSDLYVRRGEFVKAERALRQVIHLGKADKQTYILLGEIILQARQKRPVV